MFASLLGIPYIQWDTVCRKSIESSFSSPLGGLYIQIVKNFERWRTLKMKFSSPLGVLYIQIYFTFSCLFRPFQFSSPLGGLYIQIYDSNTREVYALWFSSPLGVLYIQINGRDLGGTCKFIVLVPSRGSLYPNGSKAMGNVDFFGSRPLSGFSISKFLKWKHCMRM